MLVQGDLVTHPVMPGWGIGRIVKIIQGNLLVRFEWAGEKLLHPHYANLCKISEDDLLYLVVREVKKKRGRPVRITRVIPVVKRPHQ
jgi:hypothetical protein